MNIYCIPHRKYIGVSISGHGAMKNQKKPASGSKPIQRDKTGGPVSAIEHQINAVESPLSCRFCQPLRAQPAGQKRG
jgi:hypothetical protein